MPAANAGRCAPTRNSRLSRWNHSPLLCATRPCSVIRWKVCHFVRPPEGDPLPGLRCHHVSRLQIAPEHRQRALYEQQLGVLRRTVGDQPVNGNGCCLQIAGEGGRPGQPDLQL